MHWGGIGGSPIVLVTSGAWGLRERTRGEFFRAARSEWGRRRELPDRIDRVSLYSVTSFPGGGGDKGGSRRVWSSS